MKNKIFYFQIAGFVFTCSSGILLHFLYDWTDENVIAAVFSAINESTWEHMKLMFYPSAIFSIIQYKFIGTQIPFYWSVKLTGLSLSLILIPVLYYTYTGVLGINTAPINIFLFFLSAATAFGVEYRLFIKERGCNINTKIALLILAAISLIFTSNTFSPPQIPLFQDPVTKLWGIG